jgi:uncharacterized membrane protein
MAEAPIAHLIRAKFYGGSETTGNGFRHVLGHVGTHFFSAVHGVLDLVLLSLTIGHSMWAMHPSRGPHINICDPLVMII